MQTTSNIPSNSLATARAIPQLNLRNLMLLLSATAIIVLFYRSKPHPVALTAENAANTALASQPQKPVFLGETGGVNNTNDVSAIVADAQAFYNLLSSTQQATLQLTYTTALARKWSNLPCGTSCRNGIQLGTNLTAAQYIAAMKIVKDALSKSTNEGYDEFHQMNLAEAYLHANGGSSGYDSTLRWMAFLNVPSSTGAWMLQFGGHHYAANIAFNNGHVIGATPFFMGLEPKTFTYNSVTYDPLGGERDAFRAAIASLSSTQLSAASISSSFSDCVMIPGESNGGTATFPAIATGQALSSLTSTQQNLVLNVIKLYVGDMDSATAYNVTAGYTKELTQTYISYHGNGTAGNATSFLTAQGDYMRISGPNVWIEFSCQGGIVIQGQIHYHTVWRDRSHDYGVDLKGTAIDTNPATSIRDIAAALPLSVYPNPSTTEITVQLPVMADDATASVFNAASGQLMKQTQHLKGISFTYNISDLAPGIYVLKVQNAGKIYSGKITKQY